MGSLADEIETIVWAFSDEGRKGRVRLLAQRVRVLEKLTQTHELTTHIAATVGGDGALCGNRRTGDRATSMASALDCPDCALAWVRAHARLGADE